ncbi:MAG: DUF192 domain-containing protein [Candidatus Magasanikbacteria bacterium]|nr:DUF192 domain-containing protein [Candidatus Magasanikbacteria bacterium]
MLFRKEKNNELQRWHLIVLAIVVVFAIGVRIYSARWPSATVQIGGQTLSVLVADTFQHQVKGLSNRKDLGDFQGMLFVFSDSGKHAMVMRDMHFPLDIFWMDGTTIVGVTPNLAPEPGKSEAELTPYSSASPSNMVLEIPAGFAQKYGVRVGDKLKIAY